MGCSTARAHWLHRMSGPSAGGDTACVSLCGPSAAQAGCARVRVPRQTPVTLPLPHHTLEKRKRGYRGGQAEATLLLPLHPGSILRPPGGGQRLSPHGRVFPFEGPPSTSQGVRRRRRRRRADTLGARGREGACPRAPSHPFSPLHRPRLWKEQSELRGALPDTVTVSQDRWHQPGPSEP